jgi:hypothetical protein
VTRLLAASLACVLLSVSAIAQTFDESRDIPQEERCLDCHSGIEEMHPWEPLSCTQCHGGDPEARTKEDAHVEPRVGWPRDERVMHQKFDPAASRFRNPSDLRVVEETCGECHRRVVEQLPHSLHGTTAGHLNDGLYENGVIETRQSLYGIFGVEADKDKELGPHALERLLPIQRLRVDASDNTLAGHFADLPRKACMQCHLYSDGFAMEGRLGQDGLYRSSGCAACHVTYAENGLSSSKDPTMDRFEPGHAIQHTMTAAPPTETCVSCHVGDASIGNGFRGLAQLYPQMPAGPDVPGTTDRLIANQFFIEDPVLTPPDIHHAAGMDCIDCHTARDVMGNGEIHGAMEHAVEIECVTCHGTPSAYADLTTSRGRKLENLERKGDLFVLKSKVSGRSRRVKQAKDVVDPSHIDYNARAAEAMTRDHGRLECYACHSGWNTNFYGFHFDRNEQFSQLDLITGNVTRGATTTQERVFATLRQFMLGVNPEGMISPYMVGFSTMGTVHGPDGSLRLDQALPRTAEGLSGMTMVHHQTHTTQPAARSCIECHRSPATWGLGTGSEGGGSYSLARGLVVTAGERGVETLLLDRESPAQSTFLARLPLGGARKVVLDSDPVDGHADTAFVVIANAGVVLVDVRNPAFPSVRSFVAAGDARDVALEGGLLFIANGKGGLRLVDVSDRDHPELLSDLVTEEARGLCVSWPRVYIADGPGGLVIADVAVKTHPRIVGQVRVNHRAIGPDDSNAVTTFFQYGRPQGSDARTDARMVAVVANGAAGVGILDVTEPEAVVRLSAVGSNYRGNRRALDVVMTGRFELGDTTGLSPTVERDIVYVAGAIDEERGEYRVLDVTNPFMPVQLARKNNQPGIVTGMALARSFNPPALTTRLMLASVGGLAVIDVDDSEEPNSLVNAAALEPLSDVAVESFAFDRMQDPTGRQLKDISHEGAHYLPVNEVHRVLSVPGDVLGTLSDGGRRRAEVRDAFSGRAVPGGRLVNSLPPVERLNESFDVRLDRLKRGFRIAATEPLALMVRHVSPEDFDVNGNEELSRGELESVFFELLDANGDGALGILEWPRHPMEDPPQLDKDGDGVVSRREMDLDEDILQFFDVNGDGAMQFAEWPWETLAEAERLPSFRYVDREMLRDLVGRGGLAEDRPYIYGLLSGDDGNRRGQLSETGEARLATLLGRAQNQPLQDVRGRQTMGDFLARWDIDGDGQVDRGEHLNFDQIAMRCDRDGNGKINARDATAR